jgi:hypothetical protein
MYYVNNWFHIEPVDLYLQVREQKYYNILVNN